MNSRRCNSNYCGIFLNLSAIILLLWEVGSYVSVPTWNILGSIPKYSLNIFNLARLWLWEARSYVFVSGRERPCIFGCFSSFWIKTWSYPCKRTDKYEVWALGGWILCLLSRCVLVLSPLQLVSSMSQR